MPRQVGTPPALPGLERGRHCGQLVLRAGPLVSRGLKVRCV